MPRIYGERIMLREFKEEDLGSMRKWVNDPEIVDLLIDEFLYPHTLNYTENYLNLILEDKISNEKNFVIADKKTEEYIGSITLTKIDWKNRRAELGIVVGRKELLGKGIGTEAIKLLQKFAFERMNLNKIELELQDYNSHAYKTYIKCGFVEEGRKRQHFFINNKYNDKIIMSILKEEYEKTKVD